NQGGNVTIHARIMAHARRLDTVFARLADNPAAVSQLTQTVGKIVSETYTPEDKAAFEQMLIAQGAKLERNDRHAALLPLATAAGLVDLESRWRYDSMKAQTDSVDARLVTLESQRSLFGDLGRKLEAYSTASPGRPVEGTALVQAAQAFLAEGDLDSQV